MELKKTIKIALTPERYKVVQESGMLLGLQDNLRIQPDTLAVLPEKRDRFHKALASGVNRINMSVVSPKDTIRAIDFGS